ncbi:MAG: hypothetical protein K2L18_11770, partial [Acetatifactor sp.]|nr:hypothetical protein [Acetatifactor sp.]
MKRTLRICLLVLLLLIFFTLGGYLVLCWYYSRTFVVNTWINGIYCTGMTVEEVNSELMRDVEIPKLTIIDEQGQSWVLDLSLADYRMDYTDSLREYLKRRGQTSWLGSEEMVEQRILPQSSWNQEKLKGLVEGLDWVQAAQSQSVEVEIRVGEEGEAPYVLYDGKKHRLDVEKLCDYVQQCLESGVYQVQMNQGDYYVDLEDEASDTLQRLRYEELQSFFQSSLIYDMGAEQIELTPKIMTSFLKKDSAGYPVWEQEELSISTSHIRDWVAQLARQYDTVDTTRDFQTTEGRVVQVAYKTYGTQLDVDAEVEFLSEELLHEREEPLVHKPAYVREGFCRGLDDIGDTYIEVDMGQQHM